MIFRSVRSLSLRARPLVQTRHLPRQAPSTTEKAWWSEKTIIGAFTSFTVVGGSLYAIYLGVGKLVDEKIKATGQIVEEKLGEIVEEKLKVRDAKFDSIEKSVSGLKGDLDKSTNTLEAGIMEIKSLFFPVIPKVTVGEKAFEMAQDQIVTLATKDVYDHATSKNSSSPS